MRKPDPARAVEAPPRSVASEQARHINFLAPPALHLRRKLPRIAQAQVQTLSCDRMQCLRRVADTYHVRRHNPACDLERQGERRTPFRCGEPPDSVAERFL